MALWLELVHVENSTENRVSLKDKTIHIQTLLRAECLCKDFVCTGKFLITMPERYDMPVKRLDP